MRRSETVAFVEKQSKMVKNGMKPTDIWTNFQSWSPRKLCKNGDACHERAPRWARTGTQGIGGAASRAEIPRELFIEIFSQME